MTPRRSLLLVLSLFACACSSSGLVSSDPTDDASDDTQASSEGDAKGGVDGAKIAADAGTTQCPAACARASSCGWAMPFGCGDWCYPSGYTPYLACIAMARDCAEACACLGEKACPTPVDAGDASAHH